MWEWAEDKNKMFKEIKNITSKETMLLFPILNLPFNVHIDMRKYQPGRVVSQDQKQVLFSGKLMYTQKRYTNTKNVQLSIVENIK